MDFARRTQESHSPQTHCVEVESGLFGMHRSALRKTHPEDLSFPISARKEKTQEKQRQGNQFSLLTVLKDTLKEE